MKKFLAVMFSVLMAVALMGAAADKPKSFVLKGENGPSIEFGGKSQPAAVDIVYPDGANVLIVEYAEVFAERLSEIIGVDVSACSVGSSHLKSSWVYRIFIGEEYDNSLYIEYLTAENDGLLPFIPTSEEWDKLCGKTNMFSMWVNEDGLHINASDEWVLYCAIGDFLNEVKISETYVLPVGTKILPGEDYVYADPTDLINAGQKPYFKKIEISAILPHDGDFKDFPHNMQGGTVIGDYAYYAIDGNSDYGVMYKYFIPEWTLEDYEENVFFRHANDVSYIEEENLLIASHCRSGNSNVFSYIDPDTLEVVGTKELSWNFVAMEYDENTEKYVAEGNWTIYILDKDFNILKKMPYGNTDGVQQSLYIDGDYIYDLRWDLGGKSKTGLPWYEHWGDGHFENYVYVHDYENVCIERLPLPYEVLGEPENIFRYKNLYYVGYIGDFVENEIITYGKIYKMIILPEVWWN